MVTSTYLRIPVEEKGAKLDADGNIGWSVDDCKALGFSVGGRNPLLDRRTIPMCLKKHSRARNGGKTEA